MHGLHQPGDLLLPIFDYQPNALLPSLFEAKYYC